MFKKNPETSEGEVMENDASNSEISTTHSEQSESESETVNSTVNMEEMDSDLDEIPQKDEEEDETIKAIRRQNTRERDHPSNIQCEEFITDISFHPQNDILAVGNIVGDVLFYKYSNDENILQMTLELHSRACRDIEFNQDGKLLLTASKDKSIMISDVESGKLTRFYDDAHDVPIYCLTVIDENLFSTG
nr:WD repeat-containing protein 55 homolog [Leptinotarsa decemlineata]